jgi:hypothetical protein
MVSPDKQGLMSYRKDLWLELEDSGHHSIEVISGMRTVKAIDIILCLPC